MSNDDWIGNEPSKSKSASRRTSSKQKSTRKPVADAASGWSNDIEDDNESGRDHINPPSVIPRGTRRAAEEIIATDIPTIPMNEADGDDAIDMSQQIAVAPEFSVHQIASFKEIEKEFAREHTSQYIDPKIDIGILYHNLHLQEKIDIEDQKPWNWDNIFVEIRNAITNPAIEL